MIIDGKAIAESIIQKLENEEARSKKVCFISFNPTPASASFVAAKSKVARRLGIDVVVRDEPGLSTEEAIAKLAHISKEGFDGVVVQLPLRNDMDTDAILNSIPTELDMDLLGEESKRDYKEKRTERILPVAGAIEEILKIHNVNLGDKRIVILGKGRLVGEPVAMYFDRQKISYKIFDISNEKSNVEEGIKETDIVITGIGVPHYIKSEMIKDGVVLIDAGTSESEGGLLGDVDPACEAKASLFTPVPGGVGPITVAVLFSNLFKR